MSDVPTDALVVAGGRGTRLQPITHDVPKPLVPFCGRPFLVGVVDRLATAGVRRVWLIVGPDTSPFTELARVGREFGIEIEIVDEPEPLDTAGGVRSVAHLFEDRFLVLNGDVLTDVDFGMITAAHTAASADVTIVLTRVKDTSTFGVAVRDGTQIVSFVEKPSPGSLPGQDAVNAGTYVVEPDVLLKYPPGRLSFERLVFPDILQRGGRIEGVVWEGAWADLGTPARYLGGHRLALDGRLDWPGLDSLGSVNGSRISPTASVADSAELQGPCLILEDTQIAPHAEVGPYAVLGPGSHLGAHAVVSDSVLHSGVSIGEGVHAHGLVAGRNAVVEAGAQLGRRVVLGSDVRIAASQHVDNDARIPLPRG